MFFVNYLNTPDQMAVSWATNCSAESTVQYGPSIALGAAVNGNQSQYTFMDGLYVSPYLHHTPLAGLPPSTLIFYRVGGATSGWSPVMNFTTHPGVGPAIPLRLAVLGDLGQTNNSVDTLAHMQESPLYPFDAVLHAGDLSYADSVEPLWDSWQLMVQGVASAVPYMTVVGNHEIEVDINLATFEAYRARFMMPAVFYNTSKQYTDLYYSYNLGPIHFLMLSSYSDYANTSAQYAWLLADLGTVDRSVTPWVVTVLHAPWYNSNTAHQLEGEAMRESMEPLLYAAGVDIVFAGHVHAYERCVRTYNWNPDPAGPYYITIGDGGNREGLALAWECAYLAGVSFTPTTTLGWRVQTNPTPSITTNPTTPHTNMQPRNLCGRHSGRRATGTASCRCSTPPTCCGSGTRTPTSSPRWQTSCGWSRARAGRASTPRVYLPCAAGSPRGRRPRNHPSPPTSHPSPPPFHLV